MAKTNNNNQITINQTLLNDSKIVVGKWNDRVKKENRQFKSDLKVDGLWYLIGKLMNDLTELHGSVSEEIAKKYGFNKVASRQRRHEAKIVFQNYDLATKILRKSNNDPIKLMTVKDCCSEEEILTQLELSSESI